MPPSIVSLFEPGSDATSSKAERFIPILEAPGIRLERIVSNGAASAPGFWYDQDASEWVALVRGHATLEFADGRLELKAGDSLLIPAHAKHRVSHTSADAVWLALHFRAESNPPASHTKETKP